MIEMINGKVFKKAVAAPKRIHQSFAGTLYIEFHLFLKGINARLILLPMMFGFP